MSEVKVNDRRAEAEESRALATVQQGANPMQLLQTALNRNLSPETLDKLLSLQERWEAGQARKAFDAAMAEAKAKIPVIIKNRTVDFTSSKGRTHYKHEDLAGIAEVVDPILAEYGLSYRFRTGQGDGGSVTVTCIVAHRDGHFEENALSAGRDDSGNKNSIQGIGSTITYLQRYTLKAALGLAAAKDDDAAKSEETAFDVDPWMDKIDAAFTSKSRAEVEKIGKELQAEVAKGAMPKWAEDQLNAHFASQLSSAKKAKAAETTGAASAA